MTVKHLLEQKGGNLWTIDQDATVLDALAKMAEKDIQKVPYDAGQGYHGEKRSPCPARTVGRGMHGPDDR